VEKPVTLIFLCRLVNFSYGYLSFFPERKLYTRAKHDIPSFLNNYSVDLTNYPLMIRDVSAEKKAGVISCLFKERFYGAMLRRNVVHFLVFVEFER